MTQEEREAFWEKLYGEPGFGIWQGNFRDILVDREANALISDFVARKIRQRVKDPAVAEKLIPKNHGFGTRRVPLETRYYEVYNQPNVKLVDINETPIERITPDRHQDQRCREYEFDIIIYATGFDAITGSFDRIDIRGVDGCPLKDKWKDGPQTYLGILVEGFPNMLMVMGPHAGLGNFPRAAEYSVDWVTGPDPLRTRPRPDPDRGHRGGRRRVDRPRQGAGRGVAVQRDRLVDDRRQPQCRGQADPQDHALQRRPPRLSRALRCGGGGRIPQTGAGLGRRGGPCGRHAGAGKHVPTGETLEGTERAMDVGMMMVFASYGWDDCSDARVWDEEIRLARLAADLGFDCLWSAEHHFNDYSFVPDNLQLMTYLTALCPDIDLGTAAVILPWHDPLRVAEQAAVLDMLSKGRLRLGLGRGLARREFAAFRLSMDESRERFDEAAPMIVNALKTGFIEGDGTFYKQPRTECARGRSIPSTAASTRWPRARSRSIPPPSSVPTSSCSPTGRGRCGCP